VPDKNHSGGHFEMGMMMSQKEAKRGQVMELLAAGKIDQKEAGKVLAVSVRQIKRILRRYRTMGLPGLISKKRGRVSSRRVGEAIRATATKLIGERYRDFGPTLAAEKLAELHGIQLSVESTRQLMIAAGYWKPRKGATICVHPMRERRARLGELVQIDGSPHDWFEGRADRCTLLVFIDDATGRLLQLRFEPTETTLGYMHALHDHIVAHGLPVALYSDKHSIFRINAKEAAPEAETQFGRATREPGIECIHANSPQAKGRVERANRTLQDRLPKEMRLAGISGIASANEWLPSFVARFNRRFEVVPKDAVDAHIAYPGNAEELANILSVQTAKTLSKNLSFQHECNLIQVKVSGTGLAMRGAKVTLRDHFDGTQTLHWRNRKYTYTTLAKAQRKTAEADGKTINSRVEKAIAKRCTKNSQSHKPAANHPWRKMHLGKSATDSKTVIQQHR
jgi:transposase